jgi:hypothetical protein
MSQDFSRSRFQATPASPNIMSTMRGRFIDNTWHCDCNPRLRANFFQTKKLGVNHGRWCECCLCKNRKNSYSSNPLLVYTCQKPQEKRCRFFLWEDDAKEREKALAVSKPSSGGIGLLTPETGGTTRTLKWTGVDGTPSKIRKVDTGFENDDVFDLVASDDAGSLFTGPIRQPNFTPHPPQTPRKQTGTAAFTSPRKRTLSEMEEEDTSTIYGTAIGSPIRSSSQGLSYPTLPSFSTLSPSTPTSRNSSQGQHYPEFPTPTPSKLPPEISGISAQALALLQFHDVVLPSNARDGLVTLLDKFELKMKGMDRGREIVRKALKGKDDQIRELDDRLENLEKEIEMNKKVIASLTIRDQ